MPRNSVRQALPSAPRFHPNLGVNMLIMNFGVLTVRFHRLWDRLAIEPSSYLGAPTYAARDFPAFTSPRRFSEQDSATDSNLVPTFVGLLSVGSHEIGISKVRHPFIRRATY
jgi:hypothetical protein